MLTLCSDLNVFFTITVSKTYVCMFIISQLDLLPKIYKHLRLSQFLYRNSPPSTLTKFCLDSLTFQIILHPIPKSPTSMCSWSVNIHFFVFLLRFSHSLWVIFSSSPQEKSSLIPSTDDSGTYRVFHIKSSLLTYIKIHGPFMEPVLLWWSCLCNSMKL